MVSSPPPPPPPPPPLPLVDDDGFQLVVDSGSVADDFGFQHVVESGIARATQIPQEQYIDQWFPLPGEGGNSFMLCQSQVGAHQPLLHFPRLNELRLELHFHSKWYGHCSQVLEADGFKKCPQDQVWLYCFWCRKFHLPFQGPGSHRESISHAKCRYYLSSMMCEP